MNLKHLLLFGALMEGEPDPGGGGGTPPTDAPPTDAPAPWDSSTTFDSEGRFKEGFSAGLADENLSAEFLDRFKGKSTKEVFSALKDNMSAARGKAVTYPGGDATDEDRAAWAKVAGVPEDIAQVLPQDMDAFTAATGWTPEIVTPAIQAMIDAGAPGAVITAATQAVQAAAEGQIAELVKQQEAAAQAGKDAFIQQHGAKYEDALKGAQTAVEKLGLQAGLPAESIARMKEGVASFANPELTTMFAALADTISEAQYRGAGASGMAEAFGGPERELASYLEDTSHPNYERYGKGDEAAVARVRELLAAKIS